MFYRSSYLCHVLCPSLSCSPSLSETEGASFCDNIKEEQRRKVCKIYVVVHRDLQWIITSGLFQDIN